MNCPICNSNSSFMFLKGVFDCDDTKVIECNDCGLQFLDPIMTEAEEEIYYKDYYYSQKKRYFEEVDLQTIQQNSLKNYLKYQDLYNSLLSKSKKILEIGSGTGGFLKFVKENYPDKSLSSIEISEANLEFLNNENLNNFSDINFYSDIQQVEGQKFDLIFGYGVLEHVRNPKEFLTSLKKLLKDQNSKIALNIPNKFSALVYLYKSEEYKKFTYMKQHYHTFSEKSLEILAHQIGCQVECYNYLQVWGLDNTISWLQNGKPQESNKYANIFSKKTLDSYSNDLIKNKITDLVMIVLKK
jgi:2-polyprenyl-3-methyl-5-hydroxy-6-metoxy-1,4-benzoquinol methylase